MLRRLAHQQKGLVPRRTLRSSQPGPSIAVASSSASYLVPLHTLNTRFHHYGKGKARWDKPILLSGPLLGSPLLRIRLGAATLEARNATFTRGSTRAFHSTSRRDALPLVPVLGAMLKGTSLLTLATGFSRILISFFPIGTLATFRLAKGLTWMEKDKRVPKASPDAEEFWKLWCEDEKAVRVTAEEALELVEAPEAPHDGLVTKDGRVAYGIPLPRQWQQHKKVTKPDDEEGKEYEKYVRHTAKRIKQTYFFLPSLHPAAIRSYNELSTAEQSEVEGLRRYWISLRMFKDRLQVARWFVATLILIPILLLLGVWVTGLERVPYTGRWRLILLTPEEEDTISTSLEGANWFKSVINMLTTEEQAAPPIVPLSDWRWQWVQGTLRRLESGVIQAVERIELGESPEVDEGTGPCPPPSKYPLRPRARASVRLHDALPGSDASSGKEHMSLGPPYNVMIMEAPDKNAFSYGFGGQGAGGIVIFTGLLDEILSQDMAPAEPPVELTFLQRIFGGTPPRPGPRWPTDAQTLHLATILAHEMGHLLLSHHLETLSHQQVLWPSVLGLSVDLLRAFIWPFTIFLGPAVNDALANIGRTTSEEMVKRYGHVGFEYRHEYEADLTALRHVDFPVEADHRLLSHAGFDPREAVEQFAGSIANLEEIAKEPAPWWNVIKLWSWSSHPTAEERVDAMRDELVYWQEADNERRKFTDKERTL